VSAGVAVRRPRGALAMLSPYLAGVAAASVLTGRRLDRRGDSVHVPAAFVAMHVAWGVGFWRGLVGHGLSDLPARAATRIRR